ncbi:unnamed protein product [Rhodiola kirilowii]
MGCFVSKNHLRMSTSAAISSPCRAELSSYEAACRIDADLQSFDTRVQARMTRAFSNLAIGVEVRSVSFGSLTGVTECLMEMNQEVLNVVLQCKEDIWGNQELFKLVEEYFENSLQTLDFCAALEKCLKRAKDSQFLVLAALNHFDEEREMASETYSNTLDELKNFRAAGDPFTEEFFVIFKSVYQQQMKMLQKLQRRKKKLDKKLKGVHAWRKVSNMIFLSAFAAVLISSVVAAAIAAPPVAAALSAACSIPIGSVGKWVDSLWKNYEKALKGQKVIISSMQVGTYVAIKDLDNIRVLTERLEVDITSMLNNAELALDEGELRFRIADLRKRLGTFMNNVEGLGAQADACSRDIRRARTVVLQRIIKNPTNK